MITQSEMQRYAKEEFRFLSELMEVLLPLHLQKLGVNIGNLQENDHMLKNYCDNMSRAIQDLRTRIDGGADSKHRLVLESIENHHRRIRELEETCRHLKSCTSGSTESSTPVPKKAPRSKAESKPSRSSSPKREPRKRTKVSIPNAKLKRELRLKSLEGRKFDDA